ncbi:phosphatidylserine decarboxylase family protein [Sporomusa acidovorans]|uniref:Phosphatidylserine decarboxylase proenzyme n=1 Tax=Sporomusa acidovorans (strain ATCC 49682 / DSM 3132 / Mol) TaxID=1123286 RepID=A0ABZ3J2U1_SPOA4|nr:phosphatidylserine decarboxylase family protein [Sporomusa acidovorans]OZC20194.1 phosphatidylserine decarboxylase proenzyme [Sporomusa acidovorans DSM 3132]SDD42381.1 phosphatidylserine decarboxylase [Sporomusa acidovorans]
MIRTPIVKEGYLYIAILGLVTCIAALTLGALWAIIPGVLTAFVTFFFRNPTRDIPDNDNLIVSPADGKVMGVTEVYDDQFLNDKGIKVTIFLSIFDVHVNRSPVQGEIKYQQYTCGRFKPAYKESASCENERHAIGLENNKMRILVTQIAGILARRIVSWVTLGTVLKQGERYGLIKFGSCTELVVPTTVEILVKKGDRVKGGKTVIGRVKEE